MTTNTLTNQTELNLAETNTLRRIDETVSAQGIAIVGTNYGDVTVLRRNDKFFALATSKGVTVEGVTGATAFMNLAGKLKGANQ